MKLPLAQIRADGGTQPRAHMNADVIAEYAADMQSGAQFPPVVVFYDGTNYWLADGFHRRAAAEEAGLDAIEADVKQGDLRRAILHSVGVNAHHGFRRTNADKRRAVETLLKDPEWRYFGDAEIARRCGVTHPFVGKLRQQAPSCNDYKMGDPGEDPIFPRNRQADPAASPPAPSPSTRTVERKGTVYEMSTARIGKKAAPDPTTMTPGEINRLPVVKAAVTPIQSARRRLTNGYHGWEKVARFRAAVVECEKVLDTGKRAEVDYSRGIEDDLVTIYKTLTSLGKRLGAELERVQAEMARRNEKTGEG